MSVHDMQDNTVISISYCCEYEPFPVRDINFSIRGGPAEVSIVKHRVITEVGTRNIGVKTVYHRGLVGTMHERVH